MGVEVGRGAALDEAEVDFVLGLAHAGDVVFEGDQALGVFAGRGVEADQFGDGLLVGEVGVAHLEGLAVLAPEGVVVFGLVLGHLLQVREHVLGEVGGDLADEQVVLQGLAGDVQGQVLGVHHAADEAEVLGQQVLDLVLDEHAAHVEVRAPLVAVDPEQVVAALGDEEQGLELHRGVHGDVQGPQGALGVQGQKLVELLVLFVLDVELGLAPQGGHGVDPLVVHEDGEGDEVGVALDDLLDALGVGVLPGHVVLELDGDRGPAGPSIGRAEVVGAAPVRGPQHGVFSGLEGPGGQGDLLGDHVHGVEADAEAADEGVEGLAFFFGLAEECGGAGGGDGADVLHDLVFGHAHAGVGDGQGSSFLVRGDADLQGQLRVGDLGAAACLEADFLQGVGGVGGQLAQEDLPVGVQGVHEDIEQLSDFGLEFVCGAVFGHGCSSLGGNLSGVKSGPAQRRERPADIPG